MYNDIDVTELAQWRSSGKRFVLLDVRDDDEVAYASIDGATHIPMREIAQRVSELQKDDEIAVLCHVGGRSARVAQFLAMQGFAHVSNVDGGIDAYSTMIDPSIPRY
jgi:rhodanese-related sulfurtransferase